MTIIRAWCSVSPRVTVQVQYVVRMADYLTARTHLIHPTRWPVPGKTLIPKRPRLAVVAG